MLMKKNSRSCTRQQCPLLVSDPDNYKEVNLHLVGTIDSTINQFKALMEKARKFTEDSDFTANDRTHSSSKKSEDKVEETQT